MGDLTLDRKQKVVDSLEKVEATTASINTHINQKNVSQQGEWEKKTYEDHRLAFETEYYPLWENNEEYDYKKKLDAIKAVPVDDALIGTFDKQLQPKEHFYWKNRSRENKVIEGYKKEYEGTNVRFDKNTVREMDALDKYQKYHGEYFASREHQAKLYEDYTKGDQKNLGDKVNDNIDKQCEKYGKFFGTVTGALTAIKDTIVKEFFGKKGKLGLSKKAELDEGLRPFFSMTQKTLFWKKQVGLLGTETKEERDDGSEYNKRLLRVYTKGTPKERVELMDELADKLLAFRLTPNMFTNQYMAKNMLQMQRYTDMLNGFVTMTKCNPEYLDTTNNEATHTSPEMAALIKSRIILMAPIMNRFMTEHAKYFGYKKDKGVLGKNRVDSRFTDFDNEEQYDAFVKETWEMVKEANNSTMDFMDDMAEVKMREGLQKREERAKQHRQERKEENKDAGLDDSEFEVKYDLTGDHAKSLVEIRNKISSNPYIYEIYGSDLDTLFRKINEMTRRLDELEARSSQLKKIGEEAAEVTFKNVERFGEMWKSYVDREAARYDAELGILMRQLENYKKAVYYITEMKLDSKDFKLAEPSTEVKNVLEYESMNHVLAVKDAYEYNDMFYGLIDEFDFNEYKDYADEKNVSVDDLWARHHFTMLKRGMERARMVNRLVDGKTTVDITDVTKLNNIEKRALCMEKYVAAEEKNYKYTLKEIATADITELTEKYNITKEMDITKDDTYKDYFMVKSIADIGEALKKDPTGKSIEGFEALSPEEKEEVRIRSELFMDYFMRWKGQMTYTRSEAYVFIGATGDMQGNNAIVEGLDEKFLKSSINTMKEKNDERLKSETDEKTKQKLTELSTFLSGMVMENDYEAKAIKEFGKDAYDAYRAKYYERRVRKEAEKVYTRDFDDLVKDGILKGGEEEKQKYLKRIDTGIAIRGEYEKYVAERAKKEKEKEKDKEKQSATEEEKANRLSAQYHRLVEKIKSFNDAACGDEYLTRNLSRMMFEVDECLDFLIHLRKNRDDYQLLADTEKFTEANLDDMERYENIAITYSRYLSCVIRDYGVVSTKGRVYFDSRKECKRIEIRTDRKYTAELAETDRKLKEHLETTKIKHKEEKELEAEIARVKKLYDEENKKNDALGIKGTVEMVPYETVVNGKKVIRKRFILHNANKYQKEYDKLLSQRTGFEEMSADLADFHKYRYGDYDDKIEKEETAEKGIRVDYLTKTKRELRGELMTLNEKKPKVKNRNFVDELFQYILKNAKDADMMDPEAVKKILVKAKNAWRMTLSVGAQREAALRLEEYSSNPDAMSDYFIWKNTQETNEVLAERASVFGQDKFVKANINTIRTVMDAIAEANASVNDIQTPEFLDRLSEDLDIKGIDERQFMFLLRKHNVGFSGLANTLQDADKAMLNKRDVNLYLNASTRRSFLIEAAKDALEAGRRLENINFDEKYILENFGDCYFTVNKLIAFQQLYYGEQDTYKTLEWFGGEEELLGANIRRYFDKGHGEVYALYYNAVMAVANKYGVTANGALSFGLPVTEVERLQQQGKSDPQTTKLVAGNLAEAEKRTAESFAAIKNAYKQNSMFLKIEDALDHSMAGVEVKPEERSMKGIDRSDEKAVAKYKDFQKEYARAYSGAVQFVEGFKRYGKENVTYTQEGMAFTQGMFFMAKDRSFATAKDMTRRKEVAANFANLFARDETNIARNLSVIDENKCKRVMDRIHNMGLDKGKIDKDMKTKKKITDESYLDENFSMEFYEDMVNASNYCMMFEMNDDFLNIDGYEEQIKKAVADKANVMSSYEEFKKKAKQADIDLWDAWNRYNGTEDLIEGYQIGVQESIDRKEKDVEAVLRGKIAECEKRKEEIMAEIEVRNQELNIYQHALNQIYTQAGLGEAEHVAEEKLATLKQLRKMFSDKQNRFMISTYVSYFQSWLFKNGIKADGSFANQQIFDNVLELSAAYNEEGRSISKADSLDLGEKASEEIKKAAGDMFAQKAKNISSGQYKKDFEALKKKKQ